MAEWQTRALQVRMSLARVGSTPISRIGKPPYRQLLISCLYGGFWLG